MHRPLIRCLALLALPVTARTMPEVPMAFTLSSSSFREGAPIPAKHTCDGADVSPPLAWSGAPSGAAGFALIMDDPDAPAGTWVHWVLYDLPARASALAENVAKTETLKDGAVQGRNDFPRTGYGGASPPPRKPPPPFFPPYPLGAAPRLKTGAAHQEPERGLYGHDLPRHALDPWRQRGARPEAAAVRRRGQLRRRGAVRRHLAHAPLPGRQRGPRAQGARAVAPRPGNVCLRPRPRDDRHVGLGFARRSGQASRRDAAPPRAARRALARRRDRGVEGSRQDPIIALHLHPKAVPPGLGEGVRDRDASLRAGAPVRTVRSLSPPPTHLLLELRESPAERAAYRVSPLPQQECLLARERDRACGVQVHEDAAVVAHDHRMRGHAHVGFERRRLTGGRSHDEPERRLHARNEPRLPALPRHRGSILQARDGPQADRRQLTGVSQPGVVGVACAPRPRGRAELHPRDERLCKAALVHDVGVYAIAAGWQRRQVALEAAGVDGEGMEMGERVERVPHEEQVHEVAVVRDQRGPPAFRVRPGSVVDREPQHARAPHRGGDVERPVEAACVLGVHGAPPGAAAHEREGDRRGAPEHGEPRPPGAAAVGYLARREHTLADGGADDGQCADREQRPEYREPDTERPLQLQPPHS